MIKLYVLFSDKKDDNGKLIEILSVNYSDIKIPNLEMDIFEYDEENYSILTFLKDLKKKYPEACEYTSKSDPAILNWDLINEE